MSEHVRNKTAQQISANRSDEDLTESAGLEQSSLDPRWQTAARILLSTVLLAAGLYVVSSYLRALAWAAVLGIALWPLYRFARERTPRALRGEILAIAFTLLTGFVFLLPFAFIAVEAVREVRQIAEYGRQFAQSGIPAPAALNRLPFGSHAVANWWDQHLAHEGWVKGALAQLNTASNRQLGRNFGINLVHRAVTFGVCLLALFFIFRDGEELARQCLRGSRRLFGARGERIARLMAVSVNGTVNGLVLVGIGEGLLMGCAYLFAGAPHPILFGAMTAVAAMIPFLSYLAIIVVACVLLLFKGAASAIIVAAVGAVVVFTADHFVRPALIGGATKLPFLWVLIGILGGLESLQLLGLFVGPAIMAAILLLWKELVAPSRAADRAGQGEI